MTSVLDIIFGGGGDRIHKKEFNNALRHCDRLVIFQKMKEII